MRSPLPLALSLLLLGVATCAHAARDLTFYLVSDVHVGMDYRKTTPPFGSEAFNSHVAQTLEVLGKVPGTEWPPSGPVAEAMKGKGPVPRPAGMIVAGDLTEVGNAKQWQDFDRLLPWQGSTPGKYPTYALAGNHDGGSAGPVRQGLRERNRGMLAAGLVATLSDDALHSAWTWQGVHFINVNLYPGDGVKAGAKETSMWNPESSLSFLKSRLAKIGATEPVVIAMHLDFSARSTWWDQPKRKAFYEAIKGHNIIALLHGHTHDTPVCASLRTRTTPTSAARARASIASPPARSSPTPRKASRSPVRVILASAMCSASSTTSSSPRTIPPNPAAGIPASTPRS